MTTAHQILTAFRGDLDLLPADREIPRAVALSVIEKTIQEGV